MMAMPPHAHADIHHIVLALGTGGIHTYEYVHEQEQIITIQYQLLLVEFICGEEQTVTTQN
jgi:hypothetical protein